MNKGSEKTVVGHFKSIILNRPGATRTKSSVIPLGFPTRCLLKKFWYVLTAHGPGQSRFAVFAENG